MMKIGFTFNSFFLCLDNKEKKGYITKKLLFCVFSQAEKAEGFINLTDFIIDRAMECKKK